FLTCPFRLESGIETEVLPRPQHCVAVDDMGAPAKGEVIRVQVESGRHGGVRRCKAGHAETTSILKMRVEIAAGEIEPVPNAAFQPQHIGTSPIILAVGCGRGEVELW